MNTPTKRISPEILDAAKRARIEKALAHIQRAQDELGSACGELSALCGAIQQWRGASKLYDSVHEFWYRVDGLRHRKGVYLDSTNVDALEKRLMSLMGGRDLSTVTTQQLREAMNER